MANKIVYIRKDPEFIMYIRNSGGQEVQFRSLEDYERVVQEAAPPYDKINYEPDKGLHFVNGASRSLPEATYETLIANVSLYKSRQDDPYFGLSPAEAGLRAAEIHLEQATDNQEMVLTWLRDHAFRVSIGLAGHFTGPEVTALEAYAHTMEAEILTPSDDPMHTIASPPHLL